jgi:penicillin-binding protein 1A
MPVETVQIASPCPARRRRSPHPWLRRTSKIALGLVAVGLFVWLAAGLLYLRSLPDVGDAQQRVAAILAAHHGKAADLPRSAKVTQAIVAVENDRFYTDHGIDLPSVLHGAWGYLTTGSTQVAGATISEQLAKVLYVRDAQTASGKLEMVGLALKLNQRYDKPDLLNMYLNAIYYGDSQWGIVQASQIFFGLPPDRLDWAQAALLAGLPNAPSQLDPTRHLAAAKARQLHVLARLVASGVLTQGQADAAATEPLTILASPTSSPAA